MELYGLVRGGGLKGGSGLGDFDWELLRELLREFFRFGVAWNSYSDSVLLKFLGEAESGLKLELSG